ncbi:hypothetical protein RHGRI_012203 [Rhododendron griersonianum]|uniref:NAC domain-containing protein n=1 Tax=Rhododendron griersonianum TaxID=479676 RepID=A0AAV6KQU6_9ERIC|nr:hypothetical protein RHGRI_012203 [Rhododendron griersonianum]
MTVEREKRNMKERVERENSNMTIPIGYVFRPTDEELLVDYLEKKATGQPLPCDVVIEREMYGAGDKAPWQIFTDKDPWEICKTEDNKGKVKTEGTIFVFTTLIKVRKNSDRIARTAGCGTWHGETALEQVLDDEGCVIGNKRTLYFEITDKSGAMDKSVNGGHWIMHEYSLPNGNAMAGKGEYVLCRIKRNDSRDTKISPRKRKNVEAATTDDDDLVVAKPAKRVRTESVQMECENVVALETEVVPFSEELVVQDQSFVMSGNPNEFNFTLEDFDEALEYLGEKVSVEEQQESLGFDYYYDDFGNISLTTEVDPSDLALASSVPVPIKTSEDYGQRCLNPSHISAQNLQNAENLCSVDQESDFFLAPITKFHSTTGPSPICSVSSNMHVQQDPETIWLLRNMPWPENSVPQHADVGTHNGFVPFLHPPHRNAAQVQKATERGLEASPFMQTSNFVSSSNHCRHLGVLPPSNFRVPVQSPLALESYHQKTQNMKGRLKSSCYK